MLDEALNATGAERAFLVSGGGACGAASWRLEAALSRRGDDALAPSRSVVRRAVSGEGPLVWPADHEPSIVDSASVRGLGLRSAIGVPAPGGPGAMALVLDGRTPLCVSPATLAALLGFASLAALVAPTRPESGASPPGDAPVLVGRAPAFLAVLEHARRAAPTRLPILVTGESGSGKEGICRLIHRESGRESGPYVAVNCTAFPETLLESELFGAVRGAFTGADRDRPGLFRRADGGTLLLDEIGDMPVAMQARLLRVLQEGTVRPVGGVDSTRVDVRVLAATHRDLRAEAARTTFRSDLFYRLAVIEIRVPPLRERLEDLPLLVRHLAGRLESDTGLGPLILEPSAMARLGGHPWPGNIRELESVLARALLRSRGAPVGPDHLDIPPPAAESASREPLESEMIRHALAAEGGHLARAAETIGWTRQKLYRRMAALGIRRR